MTTVCRRGFVLGALATALLVPGTGLAQNYPDHPVKIIVPVGPAGSYDILGRLVADQLTKRMGQTVLVENRPGAGSVVGGFGLSSLMKIAVARARPDRWPALVTETTGSFPSGHTVMATVFFGGLAAIVFHLSRNRLARGLAAIGAFGMTLAVAVTRIYLGAHWTTDTIAGMLTGLIWVLLFSATTEAVTRARALRNAPPGDAPGSE